MIVRCYDIEGKDADIRMDFFAPIEKAELVNMIEEEGKAVPSEKNSLTLKVRSYAIETLKLYTSKLRRG